MTLTFIWPWPSYDFDLWGMFLVEYKHVQLKDRENMMFLLILTLTLIQWPWYSKLDLDMVKMYLHTKNEVPSYSGSKVIAWNRQTHRQDRQTHRQTDRLEWNYYLPHTRMVKKYSCLQWAANSGLLRSIQRTTLTEETHHLLASMRAKDPYMVMLQKSIGTSTKVNLKITCQVSSVSTVSEYYTRYDAHWRKLYFFSCHLTQSWQICQNKVQDEKTRLSGIIFISLLIWLSFVFFFRIVTDKRAGVLLKLFYHKSQIHFSSVNLICHRSL